MSCKYNFAIGNVLLSCCNKGGIALLFGSISNDTKAKTLQIDIKAAYELNLDHSLEGTLKGGGRLLTALPESVQRLTTLLDLPLVRCAVACTDPTASSAASSAAPPSMWSPTHVCAALQLRNHSAIPSEFTFIRCV